MPAFCEPKRSAGGSTDENASRFGTDGAGEPLLLPASAFAAQLIGQVLRTNEAELRVAANAYARAMEAVRERLMVRSLTA